MALLLCGPLAGCQRQKAPPAPPPAAASVSRADDIPKPVPGAGHVRGVIRLEGAAPAQARVDHSADAYCAQSPEFDRSLLVEDGNVENAVVRVVKGLPAEEPAMRPVQMGFNRCILWPRLALGRVGQPFELDNGDATFHHPLIRSGGAPFLDEKMPPHAPKAQRLLPKSGPLEVTCEAHPWERAWVVINENAKVTVTAKDGAYALRDLPPGRYTVEAWHEKLGSRREEVDVTEGASSTLNFTFPALH